MIKQEYTYTGNMPSGNPFTWYYDASKSIVFGTSKDAQDWSRSPKFGDKITYWKSGNYNEVTERVFINGEMVLERTPEIDEIRKEREDAETKSMVSEARKRLGIE